jgi:uncharacterized protein (TIGR00369 family)
MPDPDHKPAPTPELLARYADLFNESVTLRYFGVRLAFPEGKRVEVRLDAIRPEHRGGLGTSAVNGGVLAALFDLAIGCTPALLDPTRRTATMQLSISFQRPVFGDSLKVIAEPTSAGQSVLFASAKILDSQGVECARCQGLVRISRLAWKSGESPAAY